jgi:hypothetical protein
MQQSTLSVILRLHTTEGNALPFLSNALLSLAGAIYTPIEAIVVTQQFSPLQIQKVEELLARFVWKDSSRARVVNYANPEKKDHRSALLNIGFDAAQGRYLAILDYDDYVYEHAHSTLIEQLGRSSAAVAFGGCLITHSTRTTHGYKVVGKSNTWRKRNIHDFLRCNIFPIHTFVIDRARLGDKLPRFNENLSREEDYDFLIRLRFETEFDTTCRGQVLFEYPIRDDGTNTTMTENEHETSENRVVWAAARAIWEPSRKLLKKHLEKTEKNRR